jgi:hypothetical protein
MTDDADEESVFEQEHGANRTTELDSKDTSSSSSSSASSSPGSDSESDASSEVVCTKVIQGKKYEKPNERSSDDDAINKKLSVMALIVPNYKQGKGKQDKGEREFINVMSKNNNNKTKNKTKKDRSNQDQGRKMDRAHMLLWETGHESDYDDSKADIEYDKMNRKYKTGQTRDMTKLPPKPKKKNHYKEMREAKAERSVLNCTEDLSMTIIEYRIAMDKGLLRTIVLDPTNTLFEKYTKDKPKPKPYHKADRWDRPLERKLPEEGVSR